MNLVGAEVNRFFSRRFIQLMLAAIIVVFGIMVYTVIGSSETPTDEMWAHAEVLAEQARDSQQFEHRACLNSNTRNPQACAHIDPARVRAEDFLYNVFNFPRRIGNLLGLLAAVLGCFGFLVMASFVGAEMRSGGMTNLLLWRPNRMAVLGAKFGVGLGLIAAISAVFTALYVAAFYAIAAGTGWVGPSFTDGFWARVFWLCVRANIIGLFMAVLAFAIATVGRHTAAALGSLIGYVVVWEIGARVIIDAVGAYSNDNESMFLLTHVYTWLNQPYTGEVIGQLSWTDSGTVLAFLAIAATAASFAIFQRRDLA